jgi:farnesyl diphosphate synthase
MDASLTRRGQPCWYLASSPVVTTPSSPEIPNTVPSTLGAQTSANTDKHPRVGMIAVNDAIMLQSSIFYLLKSHFRDQACYLELLEIFHDVTYKTEMGQLVDVITAPEGVVDLGRFSLDKYVLFLSLLLFTVRCTSCSYCSVLVVLHLVYDLNSDLTIFLQTPRHRAV